MRVAERFRFAGSRTRMPGDDQKTVARPMMIAAAAITAVVIQPIKRRPSWRWNVPMILRFPVMCIMATMIGTATIPLMTALQYSALIGFIGEKLSATPSMVAIARVA